MKNRFEILIGSVVALFFLSLIASFINGVVHSVKKHGLVDAVVSVGFFPWGIYRGIEYFWHDDYANVDWDKKLASDINACINIVNNVENPNEDRSKTNETIEKLANKIKNYPEDKKIYVKGAVGTYIRYMKSSLEDILISMSSYNRTGVFELLNSQVTTGLEKELIEYGLKEDIEVHKLELEEFEEIIRAKTGAVDNQSFIQLESSWSLLQKRNNIEFGRIYRGIFGEELQ
jgi:hypothetical protein